MSQKLVLPINDCVLSAGYKNADYVKQFGFAHYGQDMYSKSYSQYVYALGEGKVIDCGMDGSHAYDRLGNCIVVVYKDVEFHNGTVKDVACRMFHFAKILCKKGDKVTKDTVIGLYGNTGGTTINGKPMGYHLHIEFDTDVTFPQYTVGIARSGNIIKIDKKNGYDSTFNPSEMWYCDWNQTIVSKDGFNGWYSKSEFTLPKLQKATPSKPDLSDELHSLRQENKDLNQKLADSDLTIRKYRDQIQTLYQSTRS